MAGEICPIFERDGGDQINLIGAWMQHPVNLGIIPDAANFLELGHIGPMVASYFQNERTRQIVNDSTDVGNGCRFNGGAFLMGIEVPSPNESGGQAGIDFEYVMKQNGGITICVREKSARTRDPRSWWRFWR